jgi:hypothetical protein
MFGLSFLWIEEVCQTSAAGKAIKLISEKSQEAKPFSSIDSFTGIAKFCNLLLSLILYPRKCFPNSKPFL